MHVYAETETPMASVNDMPIQASLCKSQLDKADEQTSWDTE